MKKQIDLTKFYKPTSDETEKIKENIVAKRYKMFKYGLTFGVCAICVAIVLTVSLIFVCGVSNIQNHIPQIVITGLCLETGICSIIGGFRALKEKKLYEEENFLIREGIITEEKRKSWCTEYLVEFNKHETQKYKIIGYPLKKNSNVYVTIADTKEAKWLIERIVER